jgi:hypothetical protein
VAPLSEAKIRWLTEKLVASNKSKNSSFDIRRYPEYFSWKVSFPFSHAVIALQPWVFIAKLVLISVALSIFVAKAAFRSPRLEPQRPNALYLKPIFLFEPTPGGG